MISRTWVILLLPLTWAATAAEVAGADDAVLMEKTAHLIKWQAYWEGIDSFHGRYVSQARVKARIVRSRDQVALFIADLGISLTFSTGANGALLMRYGEWRAGDTNETAARRYINGTGVPEADADCIPLLSPSPPKPDMQPGTALPPRSVCAGSAAVPPFAQVELDFALPDLKPPSFDAVSASDGTLLRLRAAVKANIGQYVGRRIPRARVVVPRFSLQDPYVFVYVDFGAGRQGGIVRFGPEPDGSWSGDKLVTAGRPNEIAWTVRRIKAIAMETIEVP